MGAKDQGADATAGRWLTIPARCASSRMAAISASETGSPQAGLSGPLQWPGWSPRTGRGPAERCSARSVEETGLSVTNAELCGVIHVDAGAETAFWLYSERRRPIASSPIPMRARWNGSRAIRFALPVVEDLPAVGAIFDDPRPLPFLRIRYDSNDELILNFARPYDERLIGSRFSR